MKEKANNSGAGRNANKIPVERSGRRKRRQLNSQYVTSLLVNSRIIHDMLFVVLSFFLSQAVILGSIHPFAVPFVVASFKSSRWGFNISIALASILGTMLKGDLFLFIQHIIMIAALYLLLPNLLKKNLDNYYARAILVLFISIFTKIILDQMFVIDSYAMFFGLMEGVLIGLLTAVFGYSVQIITNYDFSEPLKKEDVLSVSLIAGAFVAGISDLELYSISIGNVVSALLVMSFAMVGGCGVGAGSGVLLGMTISLVHGSADPLYPSLYALGGLLAGAFRKYDKLGIIFGFTIANLIFYSQIDDGWTIGVLLKELCSSILLFMLIPERHTRVLATNIVGSEEQLDRESRYQKQLRNLLSQRLSNISSVFLELGRTFHQTPEYYRQSRKSSIVSMLDEVSHKACEECMSYDDCWKKNFHKTYNSLLNCLLHTETRGSIKRSDAVERFDGRCIKPNRIVNIINSLFEIYSIEKYWQKRLSESREIVSGQLKGVAGIMNELSGEMNMDVKFRVDLEQRIRYLLRRVGMSAGTINVIHEDSDRITVNIEKTCCSGIYECRKVITPIISSLLGQPYSISNCICGNESHRKRCKLRFLPDKSFDVEIEEAKVAREGSIISGDSTCQLELPDGRIAIIISDGMGVGPNAAMESEAAISVLKQLFEAGFDEEFAIKTVNSILILKSPEDTFATVDLALINLYNGEVKLIKLGASASFIVHGKDVKITRGKSLPVGILNNVDADEAMIKLVHGDTLVMLTDGIVDSARKVTDKEGWVAGELKKMKTNNPGEITRMLMERARENMSEHINDDLTVMAIKVVQKKNKRLKIGKEDTRKVKRQDVS